MKAGDPSLVIVGFHNDPLALKKSLADRNYLVSDYDRDTFARTLPKVISDERIDLVIPTNELDVKIISEWRESLPCRVFLPDKAVVDLCQDKYRLTVLLQHVGVPVPATYEIPKPGDVETLFRRLGPSRPLWCRLRRGCGSSGALPVNKPEQARSWIRYWQEMRGIPAGLFTLSEYLPGRDFCAQILCKAGKPLRAKMHQRVSYLSTGGASTASSMAAVAEMVCDKRVFDTSLAAIRAVDPKASGIFFVDLKENGKDVPCVTEINVGRFATVPLTHDLAGDNMAVAYVRLALGASVEALEPQQPAERCFVQRDLDTMPSVLRAHQIFDGIEDVRA